MEEGDKRLENLTSYTSDRSEKLSDKPLCVKLPVEIDQAIRDLPNTSAWVRNVLEAAITNYSTSKNYEQIKNKILKSWRIEKRAESKERIEQALNNFIEELSK